MSDEHLFDPYNDDDDGDGRPPFDGGPLVYPEPDPVWLTAPDYDGIKPPAPRRAELLGDTAANWWTDVRVFADWLIATYRLSRWIPPCWPRHPALIEELQALWLLWCQAWMPGIDNAGPVNFLHHLDLALSRIEHRWQIPCSGRDHKEPAPVELPSHHVTPTTSRWWSNPDHQTH